MRSWFLCYFFLYFFCAQSFGNDSFCLDLETAWMRIINSSPTIALSDVELEIREAVVIQEGLKPNPIVIIDSQNLGVDPRGGEADVPQNTYSVSQLLELGGKQRARKELAKALTEIAYWEKEITRQDLRFLLLTSFINVCFAHEKWLLAEEKKRNAAQFVQTTQTLLQAGKISPIKEKKAQILLKSSEIEERELYSLLVQERKKLSSLWGMACPDFDCVCYDFFDYDFCFEECSIFGEISTIPELALAQKKIFSASQNVSLQRALGVPDVTVSLGYRTYSDSDQIGWVVAAAMPIPINNKNQGNISKALAEVHQAELYLEDTALNLKKRAFIAYEKLKGFYEEALIIEEGLLTEAMEAFQLTQLGYENGKWEFLDVLETEILLFEAKDKLIETLLQYHLNKVEWERVCGRYRFL